MAITDRIKAALKNANTMQEEKKALTQENGKLKAENQKLTTELADARAELEAAAKLVEDTLGGEQAEEDPPVDPQKQAQAQKPAPKAPPKKAPPKKSPPKKGK